MMKKSLEQNQTMQADFLGLVEDMDVHSKVVREMADAVGLREAHMEAAGRHLAFQARRAGLQVEAQAPSPGRPGAHSPPADAQPPVQRASAPRALLNAAEVEVEALLLQMVSDVREIEETFALAELVSSEDFVTCVDAVVAKQARLASMERAGADACASVSTLLTQLAAERAARPTMLASAAHTRVPGLAEAALEAAKLLGLQKGERTKPTGRQPSTHGLPRPPSVTSMASMAESAPDSGLRSVQLALAQLDTVMSVRFGGEASTVQNPLASRTASPVALVRGPSGSSGLLSSLPAAPQEAPAEAPST